MWINIKIGIINLFQKVINSIAVYPAFIVLVFLILSIWSISFDFSEAGKQFKSQLPWLSLKDASTARSIITVVATGIISLTVFSFSMVMIVLNQTASQMSNRILDKLIGSRFQQLVLGAYVGTIVFALLLLSTIRDFDSGVQIPALSTYLLILLTIIDIFLFIYFLHYITQSVKYEVIIQKIYKDTQKALEHSCKLKGEPTVSTDSKDTVFCMGSGIYQGFNKRTLIELCNKNDCILYLRHPLGTFVMKGTPVITVNKKLPDDVKEKIFHALYVYTSEAIEENYFYGFKQLSEVAIKALSPGINDPGTAIESLRALFQLFSYRACNFPNNIIQNNEMKVRIITRELTFENIFTQTVLPIWDYGKNDRMIQLEMHSLLDQLQSIVPHAVVGQLLQKVKLGMMYNLSGSQ